MGVELLTQFRQSRFDPRENRGLAKVTKNAFCRCQVLNRERAVPLGLVKQAENRLQVACMRTLTVEMLILVELTH